MQTSRGSGVLLAGPREVTVTTSLGLLHTTRSKNRAYVSAGPNDEGLRGVMWRVPLAFSFSLHGPDRSISGLPVATAALQCAGLVRALVFAASARLVIVPRLILV